METKRVKPPPDLQQYDPLLNKITGCAYRVSNALGSGFLETAYADALAYEFQQVGIQFQREETLGGDDLANFRVEGSILVHLKAVIELNEIHEAQCLQDLHVTGLPVCVLINFGARRIQILRFTS